MWPGQNTGQCDISTSCHGSFLLDEFAWAKMWTRPDGLNQVSGMLLRVSDLFFRKTVWRAACASLPDCRSVLSFDSYTDISWCSHSNLYERYCEQYVTEGRQDLLQGAHTYYLLNGTLSVLVTYCCCCCLLLRWPLMDVLPIRCVSTSESELRRFHTDGNTQGLRETHTSATLSDTNYMWTVLAANLGLRGKLPATSRLRFCYLVYILILCFFILNYWGQLIFCFVQQCNIYFCLFQVSCLLFVGGLGEVTVSRDKREYNIGWRIYPNWTFGRHFQPYIFME